MTAFSSSRPAHSGYDVDVAIVGGGLAGLTAARDLRRRGLAVALFEAADAVGGRTKAGRLGDTGVDLGASFVGPTQDRVLALIAELGLATLPTHTAGKNVIGWRGRDLQYRSTVPSLDPVTLASLAVLRVRIDRLARTIPLGAPWKAPRARALDAQTFAGWIRSNGGTPGARALMRIATQVSWGCEPEEVSLLHVLHYLHGTGGLNRMLDTHGGAQELHLENGAHAIAHALADGLEDAVQLRSPVTAVNWSAQGASVEVGHRSLTARRVVFALSPSLRARIRFMPALPAPWGSVPHRWFQGPVSKAYAAYDRPFWREAGLSGEGLLDTGPITIALDVSSRGGSSGILLGFVAADHGRRWDALPGPERRAQALSAFARLFGERALTPNHYLDHRWSIEPWAGGGPVAAAAPMAWTTVGRGIAEPIGPLHWAGTETADRWTGFMDGAVRSGERVAREIAAAMLRQDARPD